MQVQLTKNIAHNIEIWNLNTKKNWQKYWEKNNNLGQIHVHRKREEEVTPKYSLQEVNEIMMPCKDYNIMSKESIDFKTSAGSIP